MRHATTCNPRQLSVATAAHPAMFGACAIILTATILTSPQPPDLEAVASVLQHTVAESAKMDRSGTAVPALLPHGSERDETAAFL